MRSIGAQISAAYADVGNEKMDKEFLSQRALIGYALRIVGEQQIRAVVQVLAETSRP